MLVTLGVLPMVGMRRSMRIRRVVPSLFVVCFLASSGAVWADELTGFWPTCWEPWEVEKANAAVNRADFAAFLTMNCGMFGDFGTRVRVVGCAADVTRARAGRFSQPVPSDDSLPDGICEVEAFEDDGSSGIYYTHYLNVGKTP